MTDRPKTCHWIWNAPWSGTCGIMHQHWLPPGFGDIHKARAFKFCPKCGGKVTISGSAKP